jgi:PPP family 3-phenylpropionic acid transporter
MNRQAIPDGSAKWIISSQYFLYFGVMGMVLPFFNLYCYHIGFTGLQIGVLSALRSIVMVLFPMAWGIIADRFRIRRSIYIACNFVSIAIWALYLYTQQFWAMLLITIVYTAFYSPIISFLEAFTMETLGRDRNTYGHLRAWGSAAFIVVVLILGKIIDLYSIEIIILLVLFGSTLQALGSLKMPSASVVREHAFQSKAKELGDRRVLVFLFCAFLMLVSHGAYYGFFSIHLENLGHDKTFIGLTWAVASTAEILVMIKSGALFKRFAPHRVLLVSFFVAALRWFILSFAHSAVLLVAAQTLHAITYGTFHMASILYIDALAPTEAKTLGQSINNALTYGLGLMVGFFMSGALYQLIGTFALFSISSGIALMAGMVFRSYRWDEKI